MFNSSYYPARYFPTRYFPKVGASGGGGGYWPCRYFNGSYYPLRYFEKDECQVVPPGPGGGYFPNGFFPCNYFAPYYFPKDVCPPFPPVPPTPTVASGAGSGRPWPQKALNILLPHRMRIDDEDVLFILDD